VVEYIGNLHLMLNMEVQLQEDPMCGTTRCKGLDKIIAICPDGTVTGTAEEGLSKRTIDVQGPVPM
jgi:hypothetical protein